MLISHASKVMFKILLARLQWYANLELPDVQAGFKIGRGTRDQTANIHWIIEKKQGNSRKTSTSASLTTLNLLTVWITKTKQNKKNMENSSRNGNTRPLYLSLEKPVCGSRSNC